MSPSVYLTVERRGYPDSVQIVHESTVKSAHIVAFRLFLVPWIWKLHLWLPASVALQFFLVSDIPANVRKTRVSKADGDSARPCTSTCVPDLVEHTLLPAVFITIPLMQRPSAAPSEAKLPTRIDALEYLALIYYFIPPVQLTVLKII